MGGSVIEHTVIFKKIETSNYSFSIENLKDYEFHCRSKPCLKYLQILIGIVDNVDSN